MLRPIALAALLVMPAPVLAQGFLDRLVGEVAPASVTHDTNPSALAERGIFVYDSRSDLTNMPLGSIGPGPHVLVLTHLSGGEPKAYIPTDTGPDCANAAISIAQVHGGGWAYCHPVQRPAGALAPLGGSIEVTP